MSAALERADALAVHVGVDHVGTEGQGGQDGRLGGGVVAVHVGARVALGQAELLRLLQDVVVARTRLLHAGEDVVGRAVDDPHDAHDLLARQRLAQGADDGDGAGHGRLVEQVDAGGGGHLGQLGSGHGEQRLVGGHDRLAVAQGGLDQLVGGMQAPDHLDHHVDVVAPDQGGRVGADQLAVDGRGPGLVGMGDGDADQLEAETGPGSHVVGAGEEDVGQGAAHVAAAEQRHAHRRHRVRLQLAQRWVSRLAVGGGGGLGGGHLATVQAARGANGSLRPRMARPWATRPGRRPGIKRRAAAGRRTSRAARPAGRSRRPRTRRRAAAPCCSWRPWRSRRHR